VEHRRVAGHGPVVMDVMVVAMVVAAVPIGAHLETRK
jgi:hypothetical protein